MTLQQALNRGYETVRKHKWPKGTYLTISPYATYFFLTQARQPNASDLPLKANRFRYDKDEWEGIGFAQ